MSWTSDIQGIQDEAGQRCAVEPDDIHAKAMEAMRRIWPDARPIVINSQHAAGYA
ncbi:hypothetical protein HN018_02835 [Lichenicola cladoniae]|uniref:Uncharacterized protein n=1 Tax=Lichenicola cladoniae TaxID=1484109 RepID=A0A6M8HLA3_9PROT|nr:hypothetical protein [Lichenicola cladoniae]NPD68929.1 hypothetical protein [Acetobacteraceae bacterium]QKE89125.1 hypothetical protein HN018_02835 [Lichenicola cladoniae]